MLKSSNLKLMVEFIKFMIKQGRMDIIGVILQKEMECISLIVENFRYLKCIKFIVMIFNYLKK